MRSDVPFLQHVGPLHPGEMPLSASQGGFAAAKERSTPPPTRFRNSARGLWGGLPIAFTLLLIAAGQPGAAVDPRLAGETRRPILVMQTGHTDHVDALAFSQDGRLLATGGSDSVVMVWEVSSGRRVHALTGHEGAVGAVDLSPDGQWLVSGGRHDSTVRLWSMATGRAARTLARSSDWIASATLVGSASRGLLHGLEKLSGVDRVQFSRDGLRLVAHNDGTIKVWDTSTWAERVSKNPES